MTIEDNLTKSLKDLTKSIDKIYIPLMKAAARHKKKSPIRNIMFIAKNYRIAVKWGLL